MSKVANAPPLTMPLNIPAYWTPEQAFAVVELLDDLRDRIWAHYDVQLLDQYREQYGPADSDHTVNPRIDGAACAGEDSGAVEAPGLFNGMASQSGGLPDASS